MKKNKEFKFIFLIFVMSVVLLAGCQKNKQAELEQKRVEYLDEKKHEVEQVPIKPYSNHGKNSKHLDNDQLIEEIGIAKEYLRKADSFSIAVIDSGVYPHENLKNNIVTCKDFVAEKDVTYDDSGHGTAVAGIIASLSDVNIVSLKVLNCNNVASIEHLIEAFEWVLENQEQYNIKVINISIGVVENKKSEILSDLCKKLNEKGVIIVTSSGNKDGVTEAFVPADYEDVISVGSIGVDKERYISAFSMSWISKSGKKNPTIYAFGENILTCDSAYLYKGNKSESSKDVDTMHEESGTSFACAVVSGITCRLIQEHPTYNKEEIIAALLCGEKIYDDQIKDHIPVTVYQGENNEKNSNNN